jgi:hypothetical protein
VEHVQWLGMTKGRAFDALHKTLSRVASGVVPPQVAAVLGTCSLVALPKEANAVCPIAVGEVLRRIVACTLCIQFRKPMAALFEPLQYGVNTCGGCEMIVHAVNAHLQKYPCHALVSGDRCVTASRSAVCGAILRGHAVVVLQT